MLNINAVNCRIDVILFLYLWLGLITVARAAKSLSLVCDLALGLFFMVNALDFLSFRLNDMLLL